MDDILSFLNSDIVFPLMALLVVVVYIVTRIRNRRRFKR